MMIQHIEIHKKKFLRVLELTFQIYLTNKNIDYFFDWKKVLTLKTCKMTLYIKFKYLKIKRKRFHKIFVFSFVQGSMSKQQGIYF